MAMLNQHRLFLQMMMAEGILRKEDALITVNSKLNISDIGQNFQQFLSIINTNLDPFHMKIQEGKAENGSGRSYIALVNLKADDPSAKLSGRFSEAEKEFFVLMIDKFLEEAEDLGEVSSIELLNLTQRMQKNLPMKKVESFLQLLEEQLWLTQEGSCYFAGPRFLLELRPLLQRDDRVNKCQACGELVMRGERHERDGISYKYHLHCAKRIFHGARVSHDD